ncbi:MAG: histidine phosphatase family protein [Chloroflexi bacterium]|nr:histidine phosphatase family protein [Chloroflexota bacterium]MBU1751341.1 histidine phosphatase family protein [Chloroflexota bacterium]
MMNLYLARHGQSIHNRDKNDPGPHSPLTDEGREQARRLGDWLAEHTAIDVVYASPYDRARQTADIVAARLGLPVHVHHDLREASVLLINVLAVQDEPWCDPRPAPALDPAYVEYRDQVTVAIRDLIAQHMGQSVLVVAHGGTVATIIRLLLGTSAVSIWTDNTAVHHLAWHNQRWDIRYMNRREHLVI